MRRTTSAGTLFAVALGLAGCADRQTPSEDSGVDSNGEDSDGGESDDDVGAEVDIPPPTPCAQVDPNECINAEGCVTVFGSEVVLEDSGAQYCGDLGFPIGCAKEACEVIEYAIVCTPDDPPEMFLLFGQCLPDGWTLCPNQMCG